jgi:erythromycin esterase-like protein
MWGNWETAALAGWLRKHNESKARDERVGFYGMDVYSLWDSLEAILAYLKKEDQAAYKTALQACRCFEPYRDDDGRSYAFASRVVPELCENDVLKLLDEIQRKLPRFETDDEHVFSTEQNALVAVNAERYYRAMVRGSADSWNVRDTHMMETLERLLDFHGRDAKAIVWAHNTHIGDSSATDMADAGMYNVGELARHRLGEDNVVLVGFGSYAGTVIAGEGWGSPMRTMRVPPSPDDTWEGLLHEAGAANKLLLTSDLDTEPFNSQRIGHRAIGVVYDPAIEMFGNYVPTVVARRYDAFLYLDKTAALHPFRLHPTRHEMPDTYPFGM